MKEEFAKLYKKILSCPSAKECDKKAGGHRCGLIDPGYLGPKYKKGGILVVGLNPGCPKEKKNSLAELSFKKIMEMLKEKMKGWEIWKNMNKVGLEPLFNRIPEIAYTNLVKCAWYEKDGKKNKTNLPDDIFKSCKDYLKKQVDILDPKVVIFLGKKTFDKAQELYKSDESMQKYLKYYIYHPSRMVNYKKKNTKGKAEKQVKEVLRVIGR